MSDDMDVLIQESLDELLGFDIRRFASRLELAEKPNPLATETAVRLLNYAERLSRSDNEDAKNRCLLVCGLLWEHRREEWQALPQFVMNLLSRIGLAPSMQMVDPDFAASGGRYQPVGSIALEAAIAARDFEHEVRVLGRVPLVLSAFQHDVWRAMDRSAHVGVSAPTSAGKSFVLLYKALDILARESGPVVYIVPTLSLIQQVTRDFRRVARQLGLHDVEVLQTHVVADALDSRKRVYVLTQERALAALAQADSLRSASLVIVDEIQNVERAADEDEERAHALFDVLLEIVGSRLPKRVVISGPRVENISQLTRQFFGNDSIAISQGLPPVVNVTYAFAKVGKGVVLRQYVPGSDAPVELPVDYPREVSQGLFGKKQYKPPLMDFVASMIQRISPNEGTLVFSPTSAQATRTALALAEKGNWSSDTRGADALRAYVEQTVHRGYALSQCLDSGVAFHHGKMPQHVRVAVEQAFVKRDVRVLACTTTLMQGVNLPAKNLIARNPDLFLQKSDRAASLTAYEFGNLRGRAGRLLKDFVGRAIILDQTAFAQEELDFSFPEKEVTAGFSQRFERNREEIVDGLRRGMRPEEVGSNGDLVVYVRQAVLRHGPGALERLAAAGIALSDDEYAMARRHVERLVVPTSVCVRAPYWDPIVLDELYRANQRGRIPQIPASPLAVGFSDRLLEVLQRIRTLVPYYYDRYFGETNEGALTSIVSMTRSWSTETPLREIISWEPSSVSVSWEKIDRRLVRLNKQVVHDVPKLLRPIVAMQSTDNPIVGMIEMGAFRPEVRRMIELGLPRETAVRIRSRIRLPSDVALGEGQLLAAMQSVLSQLNYWEREQVQSIIPGIA